jgi:HAD superfamily hydrolase (TIGR01509 family)
VLFDFDGVIADTDNHHVAAWQRTLAALGWAVDEATCARAMEVDDRVFLAELFARREINDGDVEGWVRRKQELTLTLLHDAPRVYPGVAALVGGLRGRVRLGVVTTTWRANVEAVLAAAGLRDAFSLIVGKEDVKAPKPDPAGYRKAVSRLKVAPADAVALEDTSSGLAAARAAGLRAVAVGHRLPRGEWVGPSPFLADLCRTDEVLKALGLSPPAPPGGEIREKSGS